MDQSDQQPAIPRGYTEFALGFRDAYLFGKAHTGESTVSRENTSFHQGRTQGLIARKEDQLAAFLLQTEWEQDLPKAKEVLEHFYRQLLSQEKP